MATAPHQTNKVAQLALVPLLLLLVGLWMMRLKPSNPTVQASRPAVQAPAPAAGAWEAPATAAPLAPSTRDPFQPPSAAARITAPMPTNDPVAAAAVPVRLQGIIWGVTPPRAIVNDRIVGVGESVDGVRILDITADGVTIDYQGQRAVLRVTTAPPPTQGMYGR